MKLKRTPLALIAASIILAACGGGSTPASRALTGTVIDGYIEGATVCLDLNASLTCDADEPSATTDKDGKYSLDTSKLTDAQIKAAHLLTVVPTTAKDADDGGKTLAEANKAGFSLMAPAAAYVNADGSAITGAVISPLTTLVSHEITAGNNLPLADAEKIVRTRLSLADAINLNQDFKATGNTDLASKAQIVAMTIAEVKKAALDDTSKPTEKEALLAAFTYLRNDVADVLDAAQRAGAKSDVLGAVKKALQDAAAQPSYADLLSRAKEIAASSVPSSLSTILANGFYSGQMLGCVATQNAPCPPAQYTQIKGSDGKFLINRYALNIQVTPAAWATASDQAPPGQAKYVLTDKGWVADAGCSGGSYTEDASGAALVTCGGQTAERVSMRKLDASGKTFAQLNLFQSGTTQGDTVVPAGAEVYWMTFAPTVDTYTLFVSNLDKVFDATTSTPFANIDALVKAFTTTRAVRAGLFFSFVATDQTSAGGKVNIYKDLAATTPLETVPYTIKTIGSQKVLVIQKAAPQNGDGSYLMFGEKDAFVYGGNFDGVAAPQQSTAYYNKTLMNAILKANGNKPEVLN